MKGDGIRRRHPLELICAVRPHVLVKGGDWTLIVIVGRDIVEADGGGVFSLPLIPGYSTTSLIKNPRRRAVVLTLLYSRSGGRAEAFAAPRLAAASGCRSAPAAIPAESSSRAKLITRAASMKSLIYLTVTLE